ncbi:synaptonemal complex central element protein 1 [Takifugu flavidus]|uniref:synaptonemal complex central element protein 1 n=1 Tax=Takifugu flavidus TaxID=433684 RepID=UPI0025441521|nr:synaptonemal complex central element protein 1 [Takifugu flavidus]XP_056876224.1 synaptonemal complex central element protein 1 [Takifugu flavidus]
MEDLVSILRLNEDGTDKAPKVEELMCTLRSLQKGESNLDIEISELTCTCDSLQEELHTLEIKVHQLEEIHKQKEELFKTIEFQCEETGQDCAKQMNLSKLHCDVLEQYKCEIQELHLKLQKQRVKLENQLLDLIEQHKFLESMFSLKNLPNEIKRAETTNNQLLSVEQAKIARLCQLNEELEQVKQLEATAKTQEE